MYTYTITMEKKRYPLTDSVLSYQYNRIDIKTVMDRVAEHIYSYRCYYEDYDIFADNLVDLYEKLPNMIKNYKYYGIPFEYYILRCFSLSYMHAHKMSRKDSIAKVAHEIEHHVKHKTGHNMNRVDLVSLVNSITKRRTYSQKSRGWKYKILVITLKCSLWISDSQLRKIAEITAYNYRHLIAICERLRIMYAYPIDYKQTRIENAGRLFHRLISYYMRIHKSPYDDHETQKLLRTIEDIRESIERNNAKEVRIRIVPSNNDIALLLGIPKGTVDSIMLNVQKKLSDLYGEWNEQHAIRYT